MKNFKGFSLGLVIGIALAVSSLGFAQSATQKVEQNGPESCGAMACCKGHSDEVKMTHDMKNHEMKGHDAKGGCCCCSGDSCDLKMKHDMVDKPKG